MKKILLAILPLLAFGMITNAQITFTATADTAFYNLPDDGASHKAEITINSAYSAPVDIRWRVTKYYIPNPGWSSVGLCDWVTCVDFPNAAGWTTSSMPANSSQDIFVSMTRAAMGNTGCSQIEVEIDEVNGPANRKVIIVHTSEGDKTMCTQLWPTAVKNVKRDVVNVYPNPTNNMINLSVINEDVKSVQLSNIIGKQLQRINISNSQSNIYQMSLQALPEGIYVLQFRNAAGKVIGVKRITKK